MGQINYEDKILDLFLIIGGILIALWINNWNEDRLDKKTERNYLQSMILDLDIEISAYKDVLIQDSLTRENINYLLNSHSKEFIDINKDELIHHLGNSIGVNNFSYLMTTYKDMESSGNLKLIKSDVLRQQILKYYKYSIEIIRVEEVNNGFWVENGGRFSLKNWDLNASLNEMQIPYKIPQVGTSQFSLWQLPKDHPLVKENINLLSFRHVLNQLIENRHKGGISRAKQLKVDIESYLN